MNIESKRLIIRTFREEDAEDLFDYLSLPEIYEFEPGQPITKEQARETAVERSKSDVFLAIESKASKHLVGHLYFEKDGFDEIETWHLGYILHPKHQNQGYCTEACRSVIDHAFRHQGAHRIVAECNVLNEASVHVLKKLGFRIEGKMIQNVFFHRNEDGSPRWNDSYSFALLKNDLR
ncbi:MAG: GNAT family N-acetyltransferase [Erysipelotrichaceae bacterium]